jgi:hypothetical protein
MTHASDVTFSARFDTWLVIAVAAVLGLALHGASTGAPEERVFSLALVVGVVALMFLVGIPCRYTLADDHLLIRSGLVRQRIPYSDITDVAASRSLWAAPAPSLRRVKVSYHGGFQLVSPQERDLFILALRERIDRARSRQTPGT